MYRSARVKAFQKGGVAALLMFCATLPAVAQGSPDAKFAALEKELAAVRAEQAQTKQQLTALQANQPIDGEQAAKNRDVLKDECARLGLRFRSVNVQVVPSRVVTVKCER
jgi:hypothetical protein